MSAYTLLKEFEQVINTSTIDGQYGKVEIDVNLAIHSRVLCAIREIDELQKEISHLKKIKDKAVKLAQQVLKDNGIDDYSVLLES